MFPCGLIESMEEFIVFTAIFASAGFLAYKYSAPFRRKADPQASGACGTDCGCAGSEKPFARSKIRGGSGMDASASTGGRA